MSSTTALLVGLLLLAGNAFFVGAEFAVISARRSAIEPLAAGGDRRAQTVLWAMENVSLMLACAQLGVTVCSTGLGVVAEFRYARGRARRPLKVTLPGPYTLSGRLRTGPGEVYATRDAAAEAFVPILRAELEGLVAEGATHIQIDDPSPAIHPDAPSDFAALFNAAVEPIVGRVRLGAHLCFGNYLGRPLARRTYRPVLDAMLGFRVDELVLEFANREMAEVDLLGEIAAAGRDVAAGVVDVKNYHLEAPEEVAERVDMVLAAGVPQERLSLVPDCGFSQTARWATTAKLRALVAGRDLVAGRASVPTPTS